MRLKPFQSVNEMFKISVHAELDFYVHQPSGYLSNFQKMIWGSKGIPNFLEERVIPDGASLLLFNFGKPVKSFKNRAELTIKKCVFGGVLTGFSSMVYSSQEAVHEQIGVIFLPGRAYPFVNDSMDEFKDLVVDATLLTKSNYEQIHEHLGELTAIPERIILLESLLCGMLQKNDTSPLCWDFIELIKNRMNLNTERIIQKTGYSHQYVNKIMRHQVGINVKGLQSIFRGTSALQLLKKNNEESFASIAHCLNYYDQAHFIHSMKKMTGFTPKELQLLQQPTTSRIFYL